MLFLPASSMTKPLALDIFLGSPAMKSTLDAFSTWDCVVVDLPALSRVSDMGGLGPMLDAVILVIEAGRCAAPDIQETIERLSHSDVKILGAVLNKASRTDWPAIMRAGTAT
jgi:Mrp family chromosome partitioning ATPase